MVLKDSAKGREPKALRVPRQSAGILKDWEPSYRAYADAERALVAEPTAVAGALSRSRSGRAVADGIDILFGVEPLGVDFLGTHKLTFAVRAGFVELAAFDQFLVAILRVGTLFVASLGNVLVHGLLVIEVFGRGDGSVLRRRRRRRRRRSRRCGGRNQERDHFGVHAVGRPIAILQLALGVDPLVDDGGGHARPSDQGGEQQKAFHRPVLA